MSRLFVVGLIISLAVALIAAAKNSTDSAEDHEIMKHSSQTVPLGETSTENPDEGFKHHYRPTHECGDHEKWSKCGKACENTCRRRGICVVKVCDKEWDGCRCKLGYVRNRNGKCVKPRDCNICNYAIARRKTQPRRNYRAEST
ncbi:uncharacterized protein LOC143216225 [Lasioglossum baleicum]|uniref:uncharacterized protein LOC143216225 n=1 Tax=Lasioglossum baleicum TaxID=434251 RepID=UPI003FCEB7B1